MIFSGIGALYGAATVALSVLVAHVALAPTMPTAPDVLIVAVPVGAVTGIAAHQAVEKAAQTVTHPLAG